MVSTPARPLLQLPVALVLCVCVRVFAAHLLFATPASLAFAPAFVINDCLLGPPCVVCVLRVCVLCVFFKSLFQPAIRRARLSGTHPKTMPSPTCVRGAACIFPNSCLSCL